MATFRITTPMFIGGADQNASDVRPTSVKGALRFWWRALNWQHFSKENDNEAAALRALHAEEARLFGLAASDEGGGQGVFLLSLSQHKIQPVAQPFENMTNTQLYLLGMGLGSFREGNQTLRNALIGGEFTVRLLFRPRCAEADKTSVLDALYLFGLLGALGSRARHGMGSVSLSQWQGDERSVPATREAYKAAIASLLKHTKGEAHVLPPFTAFSAQARIDISAVDKKPFSLLDTVGAEQQMYRSFGQNGKVQRKDAERNFRGDHDLIYDATNGKQIQSAPVRAVFGLPHNYFFSSSKGKADVNYAPNNTEGRRASPLLLHIHALGEQEYLAVHCLMPALFLPAGAKIRIKAKATSQVDVQVDWGVLKVYLNRFPQKETLHG
jgi:CRISPR-associated protein Cmr1